MASDLQRKSKQTAEAVTPPVDEQKPNAHPANPDSSPFTAEQRQILGNVYRLIPSWRRDRLMKATPNTMPAEREA